MKEIRHLDDYYDHQRQSSIDAGDPNVRKVFVLEYCDDPEKLERVDRIDAKRLDYDDVYHTIRFEEKDEKYFNAFDGIAMEMYLRFLFNPKICDVKLWEEIHNGGELIQERWIEFPSTFSHDFGKLIERDLMENRNALKKQVDALATESELMLKFIRQHHFEDAYKRWKDERTN